MIEQNKATAILLRQLASLVEAMTISDIEAVVNNNAKLSLNIRKSKKERILDKGQVGEFLNTKEPKLDIELIRMKLDQIDTRDNAANFLLDVAGKKHDLVLIAREMSIPVQSSDTIETIRNKIVDATVGYRLRSKAIRDKN
ncbi:hypothetical protein SAE02_56310 [Skermanella aerolata]|uniref:Uncharacterized protein n=1 Tax=Skermanella aerolata TaxID=393310 RepID=A0A512DYD0_9PROT|nr:hypothetical protein [Skermanella aerolata]GEO41483.1 hypothetical protein SAE02_56310 [Skermanella aerolata]